MLIMTVQEAREQKFTLQLFHLWVCLFLSTWIWIGHAQFHSPPEVVVPLRVTGRSGGIQALGWITYEMYFAGKKHTVSLKNKKFSVYRDLSVFTYSDKGELLQDYPFVQNDCYYHGYVDQDPESLATLSTCLGGFHGMLFINDTAYEIKPKKLSTTFEHLVYPMDMKETQSRPIHCGLTEEKAAQYRKFQGINNTTLMQSSYLGWWIHKWFLELAIVVDNGRFVFRGRNVTVVEMDVVMSVSVVNDRYNLLDVDMVLTAIEIWTDKNPVDEDTIDGMLMNFCLWKEYKLRGRVVQDSVYIIIKQPLCLIRSTFSFHAGVCNRDNCGIICATDNGIGEMTVFLTHELGHTLGMWDDEETCTCEKKICIMNNALKPADTFSNCSYNSFFKTIAEKKCMYNSPNSVPDVVIRHKLCGNGVVEDEEECDCGSLKTCVTDPCCFQNCTLKEGAMCASGLCCRNCQFLPKGIVCRAQNGVCDLPEWCNGSSSRCPEDVYAEDGLSCLERGICYKKICTIRENHCRALFGEDAKSADLSCYLAMNTQGNRFGHCGIEQGRYKRCKPEDALCGRIQCEGITQIPVLEEHNTVYSIPVDNVTCWSTDYHYGMTIADIGEVKDGTECGLGLMCLDRKCSPFPGWEEACLEDACSRRGICNNKHHCHCSPGWAPPNCQKHGNGGSIDSGPPPKKSFWYLFQILLIWINLLIFCTILLVCILALLNKQSEEEEESAGTEANMERPNVEQM
ncbi:disintegrin and metalloproteinase domain-containing protein 20-like [Thomomys bottae]